MIRVYMAVYDPAQIQEAYAAEKNPVSAAEHRLGRQLLNRGLRELYALPEQTPAVGAHGKPYLKEHPEIHFNISHCSGLVVCVFAEHPVGIDVETVRPVRESLLQRVLDGEEQVVVKQRTEEADSRFFRYWTLKESYVKCDGCGLTRELREICFAIETENQARPVCRTDPEVCCFQKCFYGPLTEQPVNDRRQNTPLRKEYILSVCVKGAAASETLQIVQT